VGRRRDERPCLERAEPGLSLGVEDLGDGAALLVFDLEIQVDERHPEATRELGAHRGLARPGHPDEIHDHGRVSR
jgi:hypothetical protein